MKEYIFKNHELKRTTTEFGRTYMSPNGIPLVSVTTALGVINKPALMIWSASQERNHVSSAALNLFPDVSGGKITSMAQYREALKDALGGKFAYLKTLKDAGQTGTNIHNALEWKIKKQLGFDVGEQPLLSEQELIAYISFESWMETVHFKPIAAELAVYSETHQYAGTLDLIAMIDGHLTIVDYKSSKKLYVDHYLQASAYVEAARELYGIEEPIHALLLRLPKSAELPGFEPHTLGPDDIKRHFPAFLNALALYKWQKIAEKKNVGE